jgi:predicted acetyltransferase
MNKYQVFAGEKRIENEEYMDFLAKIFGPNYYDALSRKRFLFDAEPSMSPKNFIIARSPQGDLIGVVRIVERIITVDGVQLSSGGITSIGVKPDWRGQGVASNLINTAIEVMTSRDTDISIVYGRRAVDGFYNQFGYYGVGRYVDLHLLSLPEKKMSIKVVPLTRENRDLCMKFYSETYNRLPGSVIRDSSIWDFLLRRMKEEVDIFRGFLIVNGKDVIGYLILSNHKAIEIIVSKEFFPAVPHLFQKLKIDSISIHPRHPFYIFCRTRMNTVQKERFAFDGGYMARILNPMQLLTKLGPLFALRAEVVGASKQVLRILDYEIELQRGKLSGSTKGNDVIFDRPETAVHLLLGVMRPNDILGIKWAMDKPWIPLLFPELYYHTSAWDEI